MRLVAGMVTAGLLALAAPLPAAAKSPPMTFTGPDLPYTITAPWPDQKAFWEMDPWPTTLAAPPAELGHGYEVVSWFWNKPIPGNLQADEVAIYYPEPGIVRVTRGDEVHWIELDEARNALLQRYVILGRQGVLPPEPTILDVLIAAVVHAHENVVVEIGGQPLTQKRALLFWQEAESLITRWDRVYVNTLPVGGQNFDLKFRLPEGRYVSVRYIRELGYLVDLSALGGYRGWVKGYKVTAPLQALLEAAAPPLPEPNSRARLNNPPGDPAPLPLWAIAAGAAAGTAGIITTTLGAAAFVRRR